MTTISPSLDDQLASFDKIISKTSDSVTFKDIISLIFYAVSTLAKNSTNPDSTTWANFYYEFEHELTLQNQNKWPKLSIIKNDYEKHLDIMLSSPFIKSTNLLMLLLRLLYIENYERKYIFKTYNYPEILNHRVQVPMQTEISKLSLSDLFDLLKHGIQHYHKIYRSQETFEYQLAKAIYTQLD